MPRARVFELKRSVPHRSLPPCGAGVSHMEILESHPLHRPAAHMCVHAGPRNRIGNRPESKRERLLRAFEVSRSQQPAARDFFPYAIPLPTRGEGTLWHRSAYS